MAIALTANQLPAIPTYAQSSTPFLRRLDARSSANSPVAYRMPLSAVWAPAIFDNELALDLVGAAGGGGIPAVAYGLGISLGTGLSPVVAAGQGRLYSIVENPSSYSVPGLSANMARYWLYMDRTGAISAVADSGWPGTVSAPPAGDVYLFLGSVVTGAAAVSSVDTSGVFSLLGGMPVRYTADTSTPSDTPPSNVMFYHVGTNGRMWMWNGSEYVPVTYAQSGIPTVTVGAAAGATGTASLTAGSNGKRGQVSITVATGTTTGVLATITLANPLPAGSYPVISPANAAAAGLGAAAPFAVMTSASAITINANGAALPNGTYLFNYSVQG